MTTMYSEGFKLELQFVRLWGEKILHAMYSGMVYALYIPSFCYNSRSTI